MMSDMGTVDGSWELTITVTDLQLEKNLRVKGDLHIGGVMLNLVEALDIAIDWSDHALWWPEKNKWLTRTRSTLDQYGVQADARLHFTPMHKTLMVQLPDLQLREMKCNFSKNVFKVVITMCKELGIRHPEELSLSRKLDREELKKNKGISATRRQRGPGSQHGTSGHHNHSGMMNNSGGEGTLMYGTGSPHSMHSLAGPGGGGTLSRMPSTPGGTLRGPMTPGTPGSPYSCGTLSHSPYSYNGTLSPGSLHSLSFENGVDTSLMKSPIVPTKEALLYLYKPKNYSEKARINAGWLDSSRSLMEQGLRDNSQVLLRFKFFNFYDLNPKYDMTRINQIYEQAKWSLISEEIECTEEEMMMFSALQLQVQLQSSVAQPSELDESKEAEDDIDAALTDLQNTLEGSSISTGADITQIPELADYLRFFRPRRFKIKTYKRYFFKFKDTQLSMYRSHTEVHDGAVLQINLKGCEVNPDVNISAKRYNIRLFEPSNDVLSESCIRCETEDQYARWMAACKLASKGKTMADSSYDSEVQAIQAFLRLQHPAAAPVLDPNQIDFKPEDFVAPRFLKKLKVKQIATRILEAHTNVQDMNLMQSKMNYIKAWQALPEYGITYFIVKFKGSKKEELMGVASNRLIRMDLHTGDTLKTWRFSSMKAWDVNWEVKQIYVTFQDERLPFFCLTADCKVVHEFIGGYIFLSMRSADKSQTLNEELFHKLTGGWG